MVTRRISTGIGEQWAFYPDLATAEKYDGVDNKIVPCTKEQMLFLVAHPETRWDGEKFATPSDEVAA
jgi:hypothetical protein